MTKIRQTTKIIKEEGKKVEEYEISLLTFPRINKNSSNISPIENADRVK